MTDDSRKRIIEKFDEINLIINSILVDEDTETISKSAKQINDEVLDFLIEMYVFGFDEANYMLGLDNKPDTDKMYESIFKKIDDKNFEDRIKEYVENGTVKEIARVIDTDSHRVLNEGMLDSASNSEKKVYKTWITMEDTKVRDTHFYLHGVKIPLDEMFTTYTGEKALSPGGFTTAEENCNCRCVLDLTR